jgi:hypothetical protein
MCACREGKDRILPKELRYSSGTYRLIRLLLKNIDAVALLLGEVLRHAPLCKAAATPNDSSLSGEGCLGAKVKI